MPEQFTDNAVTTLAGAGTLTAAATTVPVTSLTTFPTNGSFDIAIENELCNVPIGGVDAANSQFINVSRPSGVTHVLGVRVAHVLTASSFRRALSESAGQLPAGSHSLSAITIMTVTGTNTTIPTATSADGRIVNGVYTVPAKGTYLVALRSEFQGNASSAWVLNFFLNAGSVHECTAEAATVAAWAGVNKSIIIDASAGDTLSMQIHGGGTLAGSIDVLQVPGALKVVSGSGGDQVWSAPTLVNGWTNYGGTTNPAGYRKDAQGFVHLTGLLTGGTASTILTLPAGYYPVTTGAGTFVIFAAIGNSGTGDSGIRVDISNTGVISTGFRATGGYLSLDGLSFYAGPVTAAALTNTNEDMASILTNATSAGDAGNRADHFQGSALAGWTTDVGVPGSIISRSILAMNPGASAAVIQKGFTPTGAFRVEARMLDAFTDSAMSVGMIIRDSGAGDYNTGESVMAIVTWQSAGQAQVQMVNTVAGTPTTSTDVNALFGWVYLAIQRDAANNFSVWYSPDRVNWITVGSAVAHTFTVAKMELRAGPSRHASFDFIDVVS